MRASMMSLMLTVLLTSGATYYYFRHAGAGSAGGHAEVISTTGVTLDLTTIAHAEQAYFSTNGSYGKMDQLESTGVVDKVPTGRDGFTYAVETTSAGFVATASRADGPDHVVKISIDQSLKVSKDQ